MSDHDADDADEAGSDAEPGTAVDHADDGSGAHGHENEEPFDRHEESDGEGRVTSPMQAFESSQVTTGFVVLVVGLVVTFAIPLLL
jgi:hypothetical protein